MTGAAEAAPTLTGAAVHWDAVWDRIDPDAASWAQPSAERSVASVLGCLAGAGADRATAVVVDVGGGASPLAGELLDAGLTDVTVVDLAATALARGRARLGERGGRVTWRVADARDLDLAGRVTVWHDRAVLHFLSSPADTELYTQQASRAIAPGGHAVISGFAPDGPERCSGLPVVRRSPEDIARLMGAGWSLLEQRTELHLTPGGNPQAFAYALLRREF